MKKLKVLFIVSFFVFACAPNDENITPSIQMKKSAVWNAEQIGELIYERITFNALEDPLQDVSEEERQSISEAFDRLKGKGSVNAKVVLDEQLEDGKITLAIHDGILKYNEDIMSLLDQISDVNEVDRWCLDREAAVKDRDDLTDVELEQILTHHAIIRNYVKAEIRKFVEPRDARINGWKSIFCYIGCGINNITSFSSAGSLFGQYGAIAGAATGLVYTIAASESCGCSEPPACQQATSVSSPDVCYSAAQGKSFQAFGYGTTPAYFLWQFFEQGNYATPFHALSTTIDQYTLTNAQMGGRVSFVLRVVSYCNGTERFSPFLPFNINDAGRPRPRVTVTEMGGNQARYYVVGSNNGNPVWSFVPPYRGTLVAGNYNSNTITIQWVSPQLRIGANVTTTSPCGTATANAY
jgi:hypothetical protein